MLVSESDIVFKERWFFATECEDGYFVITPCRPGKMETVMGEQHKQRLWEQYKNKSGINFYFFKMSVPVWLSPDFVPF